MLRLLLGPVLASLATTAHGLPQWCSGTTLAMQRNETVEVIWAQAALFSANNGSDILGHLNLFHTAIIFKQGDHYQTLEFDDAGMNAPGAPAGAQYYPSQRKDPITNMTLLDWNFNSARWCLTEGLLWGQPHWKKAFKTMATVNGSLLYDLFDELIQPTNSSSPFDPPFYNTWNVKSETDLEGDLVQDISCGNGATWVRDYLYSRGVDVARDLKVTRVAIHVRSVQRLGPQDAEWPKIVDFYAGLRGLFNKGGSKASKFMSFLHAFPLRYVYDGNNLTHPYLKLIGKDIFLPEKIKYERPPLPWGPIPGPHGAIQFRRPFPPREDSRQKHLVIV